MVSKMLLQHKHYDQITDCKLQAKCVNVKSGIRKHCQVTAN